MSSIPTVYLVGAGPGHPGLLTLRGAECLRRADLVLYDKLVSPLLLEHAPAQAEKRCVAELAPHHDERIVPIHDAMIAAARSGKRVVRLKGGDPFVFGRGAEEAEVLRQAGVPFEIVPGVTAALGAAAYAGISLTHRAVASAVAFVTGHENPHKPESVLDWNALARFPGTLVIYMGMSRLDRIVPSLLAGGKPGTTPAAAVQCATLGQQRTLVTTLSELPRRVREEGFAAPALIFIGPVVELREQLEWFGQRPLFGRRVLVTRPRHQAGAMVQQLVELGAVPFVLPTVEIRAPADWSEVDRAIRSIAERAAHEVSGAEGPLTNAERAAHEVSGGERPLTNAEKAAHEVSGAEEPLTSCAALSGQYDWLVFTSGNGVHAFLGRIEKLGFDLRILGRLRIAAIGPKTAEALAAWHLRADLVPARYQSEDLAAALLAEIKPGNRVLLARADRGREVLREQLGATCHVEQIAVYAQVDAVEDDEGILDSLRRGEIEFVTLTSSNIARGLLTRLDATCRRRIETGEIKLVSISPVTSEAIASLGFTVAAQAAQATTDSMLDAMVDLAGRSGGRLSGSP